MSEEAPDKTRQASPVARKRAVDEDTGAAIGATITATDGVDGAAAIAPERTPELDDTALAEPVDTTGGTGEGARRLRRSTGDPLIGQSIDRYRIDARLGAGGMGVVYRAYDPALDRKVALKLLPSRDEGMAQLETRLRREAQALARLDHPNVVAVYDVGVAAHSVFVAMQLVEGSTLGEHLTVKKPTPAETLALFIAAGRGLAAAHHSGIVHRDVKPANVLVDGAGRVRVGDFGLARSQGDDEQDDPDTALSPTSLLHAELTRAGAVMGTPLYMSPEQHHGEPATARSDQFSFCVCLWEALTGQHPFHTGKWDAGAVVAAMDADRVREPPRVRGVPARVITALRRGLRGDPAARWPSMDALLAALEPRRVPAWAWIVLAGAVVVGAVFVTSWATRTTSDPAASCRAAVAKMRAVWPAQRAAVRAALDQSKLPDKAAMADNVSRGLDDYTRQWTTMRLEICDAPHRAPQEQSLAFRDMRERCLDDDREVVRDLIARISGGDRALVAQAAWVVAALPVLSECSTKSLVGLPPLPVDHLVEIADIRRALGAINSASFGSDPETLTKLRALLARAQATGYAPLVAQAKGMLATALYRLGTPDMDLVMDSAADAEQAHADRAAASAYMLALDQAIYEPDLPKVETLLPIARSAAARAGDPQIMARMQALEGEVAIVRGHPDEGVATCEAALATAIEGQRSQLHTCLVVGNMQKGDLDAAAKWNDAELADEAAHYGVSNDSYLAALRRKASIAVDQGHFDQALATVQGALDAVEQVYGVDTYHSDELLIDLAQITIQSGDVAGALAIARRALAAAEKSGYQAQLFYARMTLAQMLKRAHQRDEMLEEYRAAQAIGEQILSPDDPNLAALHFSLGSALAEDKRYEEADALVDLAARALERTHNPRLAATLAYQGEVLQETGKFADSIPIFERAVRALEAAKVDARNLQATRLNLAISYHQVGEDARSRELTEQVLRDLGGQAAAQELIDEAHEILAAIAQHRDVKL